MVRFTFTIALVHTGHLDYSVLMKLSLSHKEAHDLYAGLAFEAFDVLGANPNHIPNFRICDDWESFRFAMELPLAYCDWMDDLYGPAKEIVIHQTWLNHLYEDEYIVVILHEIAHAAAGFVAGHGPRWAEMANVVGSIGEPVFHARNYVEAYHEFGDPLGPVEYLVPVKPVPSLGYLR